MHETNAIDERYEVSCINILNGCENEMNGIASEGETDGLERAKIKVVCILCTNRPRKVVSRACICIFCYMKMKWCNNCRHWNEVKFQCGKCCGRERSKMQTSIKPLARMSDDSGNDGSGNHTTTTNKKIKYIDFNKWWHMENRSK